MALNIKGKVNKIVIEVLTSYLYGYIRMIPDHIVICCCHLSTYRYKCAIYCNILWFKDTKVVIRKSKKDSKHNGHKNMDN
jgi:hypothetical protein